MAPELIPIIGPAGAIIVLLVGLFHALRTGALRTSREVNEILGRTEARIEREQEISEMWLAAYESEKAARAHDLAAINETLELARLTVDLLQELKGEK